MWKHDQNNMAPPSAVGSEFLNINENSHERFFEASKST
jgi:hypothetical protein